MGSAARDRRAGVNPSWISAAISSVGALILVGSYVGIVKGLREDRDLDRRNTAEWRKEIREDMEQVRNHLQELLTTAPLTNERVGNLQTELDFQRGRIHELANQISRVDAKHEERFNSAMRMIDRLKGTRE